MRHGQLFHRTDSHLSADESTEALAQCGNCFRGQIIELLNWIHVGETSARTQAAMSPGFGLVGRVIKSVNLFFELRTHLANTALQHPSQHEVGGDPSYNHN